MPRLSATIAHAEVMREKNVGRTNRLRSIGGPNWRKRERTVSESVQTVCDIPRRAVGFVTGVGSFIRV